MIDDDWKRLNLAFKEERGKKNRVKRDLDKYVSGGGSTRVRARELLEWLVHSKPVMLTQHIEHPKPSLKTETRAVLDLVFSSTSVSVTEMHPVDRNGDPYRLPFHITTNDHHTILFAVHMTE